MQSLLYIIMHSIPGCCLRIWLRGWAEKLYRVTMTQWSNLTKCGLFFNIVSPVVYIYTTFFDRCCSAWIPHGIEALILILGNVLEYRCEIIIGLILLPGKVLFSCQRTENCQIVLNQENMEGDQPVQSYSQAQQPLIGTTVLCAGAVSW